ncbi:hypothetical protein D0C16_06850 [Cellvibrio sp. KY-GH-1]|nr:hypothetical protein D0C16_06850 [Cellvibrio sp. KY-GH-1]
MLQRFVIGGFQATEVMPKPEQEAHPLKFQKLILTAIWLSGNRKEAEKFEIQFHPPSKPIFP